jgi:hypothetical protein
MNCAGELPRYTLNVLAAAVKLNPVSVTLLPSSTTSASTLNERALSAPVASHAETA